MSEPAEQPNPEPVAGPAALPETIEPRTAVVRDPDDVRQPQLPEKWQRRQRRAWILFVATCLSTWLVGALQFNDFYRADGSWVTFGTVLREDAANLPLPEDQRFGIWNGLRYSLAVMGILLAHEMGHYLQARRYKVPATLPFFIPMPISPFGTMGAVILQGGGTADRKSMFDIAITGPLAGLVVTIPVLILGIQSSVYQTAAPGGTSFGDPLLVKWIAKAILGAPMPGEQLINTPLLFAGWVGVFITSLNLIPVGQLDGGHILYCLIGRRAHDVALMVIGFGIAVCVLIHPSYVLIIVLLLLMGVKHPPTRDDTVAIGPIRRKLGWLTLGFIFIGLTPRPITVDSREPPSAEESDAPSEVEADYGDGQAAYHFRGHTEVLDLRMSIGNRNGNGPGSGSRAGTGFGVFENHHLVGFHA